MNTPTSSQESTLINQDPQLKSIFRFTEHAQSRSNNIALLGSRCFAYTIDKCILFVLELAFGAILGIGIAIYRHLFQVEFHTFLPYLGVGFIAVFIATFTYYGLMEILPTQGTLGKVLTGMIVARDDGQPLRMSNVFIRALVRGIFINIPLGIFIDCVPGLLMGPQHKTIHDWAAGTVVIIRPRPQELIDELEDEFQYTLS